MRLWISCGSPASASAERPRFEAIEGTAAAQAVTRATNGDLWLAGEGGVWRQGDSAVRKVSIVPRGRALGLVMSLPEGDRYSKHKSKLKSELAMAMGGRVAEELIFGADKVTTGASNDIERATKMARNMATKWGLSELGPITFGEEEDEVFLGRSVTQHKSVSDDTARKIDEVVRSIRTIPGVVRVSRSAG